VESVLEDIAHLSANYQLVVSNSGSMDEVEVRVEAEQAAFDALSKDNMDTLMHDTFVSATRTLQKKIKDNIGLSMKITLQIPGSIPRSEGGKLSRIVDQRKK
jgi:phenylacetate-CoA ligase